MTLQSTLLSAHTLKARSTKMAYSALKNGEKMWDMNFNPSKYQVLHATRLKPPFETKYFLHDTELDSVSNLLL